MKQVWPENTAEPLGEWLSEQRCKADAPASTCPTVNNAIYSADTQHGTANHRCQLIRHWPFLSAGSHPWTLAFVVSNSVSSNGLNIMTVKLNTVTPCGSVRSTGTSSKVGAEELTPLPPFRRWWLSPKAHKEGEIHQAMKSEFSSVSIPQSHTGPPNIP